MSINGEHSKNCESSEMGIESERVEIDKSEMVVESAKSENSNGIKKSEMDTSNCKVENSNGNSKPQLYVLKPAFLRLLETVGATGVTFTFTQVVDYLQNYIYTRRLFDPLNPRTILCKDDELGKVLGVQKFTISEVIYILRSVLFRVSHQDKNGSTSSVDFMDSTKRRASGAGDDTVKRVRVDANDEQSKPVNSIFIYLPDPPNVESASETELSAQGYETSLVKNSSYDSWISDDEDEDIFSVEYDVRSLSSDNGSVVVSDTDSDIADILHATIILQKNDTDIEFWADDSSDESTDPEMSEGDKWTCGSCGSLNRPPMRFCQRCWEERVGWLPSKRQHPPRNLRRRPKGNISSQQKVEKACDKEDEVKLDLELSTDCKEKDELLEPVLKKEPSDAYSTAESFTSSQTSLTTAAAAVCPLCLHRQKTATIIHGKTGHQMCCYPCARHLESKKLPCPICRRTIQKVVRNYIV